MRKIVLLLLLWPVGALGAGPPRASLPCPPPLEQELDAAPLPHLAVGLRPGQVMEVLVIGSATGLAPQAGPREETKPPPAPPKSGGKPGGVAPIPAAPVAPQPAGFPWQMARALETSVSGLRVNLTVISERGRSAEDMLERLQAELGRHPYRLVVWQTGTVDAVNAVPPGDFYETLADGAAAVAASGADLVLVDPQYSRFLQANANLSPYLEAMQAVSALPGVVLFHRFDLMHAWADAGAIDLEHARRADRPAVATRLHACLGRELARLLVSEVGAAND